LEATELPSVSSGFKQPARWREKSSLPEWKECGKRREEKGRVPLCSDQSSETACSSTLEVPTLLAEV